MFLYISDFAAYLLCTHIYAIMAVNMERLLGNKKRHVRRYQLHSGVTYSSYWRSRRLSSIGLTAGCLVLLLIAGIIRSSSEVSAPQLTEASRYTLSQVHRSKPNTNNTRTAGKQPTLPLARTPTQASPVMGTTSAPWADMPLFTEPDNTAIAFANNNPQHADASLIGRMGKTPVAHWFGDWDATPAAAITAYVTDAARTKALPVVVLYNIPHRDCGNYSAGGATSADAYLEWIQSASKGLANKTAIVILEPDALAGMDCLSSADCTERLALLAQAVRILKANKNVYVYIDSGNPAWRSAESMAERLRAAGIEQADGFSLNVSNYTSTNRNQQYGDAIARLVHNAHYVIDTSRNGNSAIDPAQWCNNHAAALGDMPTVKTGHPLNDALLWIKIPWESDGTCNNGPRAGDPYWSFAAQLARNANW